MDTEITTPTFKKIENDISRFRVGGEAVTPEYENYVNLTAKLLNRSYIATAASVSKWPLEKIIQRYELCTKHAGTMPGDVKWWWLRKQEIAQKSD